MRTFKSFRIKLPSGERYWTVVDDSYRPVQGVDDWLLYLRIGRDCAESTTESYAGAVALSFEWCALIGRDWHTTAGEFGRFVYWLQHYDLNSAPSAVARIVRGPRRVNVVLAAVREYFRHAAARRGRRLAPRAHVSAARPTREAAPPRAACAAVGHRCDHFWPVSWALVIRRSQRGRPDAPPPRPRSVLLPHTACFRCTSKPPTMIIWTSSSS
jgi:hypothetical protein